MALLNEGKVRIHFQCKPRMFQSVQEAGRLLDFLVACRSCEKCPFSQEADFRKQNAASPLPVEKETNHKPTSYDDAAGYSTSRQLRGSDADLK